ncbi:GGDEF domain-containing protein [Salinicola salarius]|uniref:diguanylate cyclase domain-containing protein n=1 Tax=Salinicola salarius TaxID=430457 RepID=UPI0023E3AFF4|nr:GGDEF domain-containing protein [Salinicola salarius]MDF3919072.1 GGDEF domain-containing protein [Salinicola salarius]
MLTGLPNRASLDARLEREYRKSLKRQSPLTVMYLDLDGFKTVNDGLGHPVGNRMLVAVAKRLRQYVAAGDMLARVGGDEFIFLLPHLPHHDAAAEAAKNILEAFESPFDIDGKMLHISTSIGSPVVAQTLGARRNCCNMPTWPWRARNARGAIPGSGIKVVATRARASMY